MRNLLQRFTASVIICLVTLSLFVHQTASAKLRTDIENIVSSDFGELYVTEAKETSPDSIKSPLKVYCFRYGEPVRPLGTTPNPYGNGNITEYVDDAKQIVAHYEYSPFGKVLHSSGSKAGDFSYQFSTKPLDKITKLHYYGYRWYDASQGRWINRDPIKEDGGLNVYDFCGGDPINKFDVLGLNEVGMDILNGTRWVFGMDPVDAQGNVIGKKSIPEKIIEEIQNAHVEGLDVREVVREVHRGVKIVPRNMTCDVEEPDWSKKRRAAFDRASTRVKKFVGQFVQHHKEVGKGEGYIPFWGSLRSAGFNLRDGNILLTLRDTALGITDIALVKSAASLAAKTTTRIRTTTQTFYRQITKKSAVKECPTSAVGESIRVNTATKVNYPETYLPYPTGEFRLVEGTVKNAGISPLAPDTIIVNKEWWASLNPKQRSRAVREELAHGERFWTCDGVALEKQYLEGGYAMMYEEMRAGMKASGYWWDPISQGKGFLYGLNYPLLRPGIRKTVTAGKIIVIGTGGTIIVVEGVSSLYDDDDDE